MRIFFLWELFLREKKLIEVNFSWSIKNEREVRYIVFDDKRKKIVRKGRI